jgi:hypothetical protein
MPTKRHQVQPNLNTKRRKIVEESDSEIEGSSDINNGKIPMIIFDYASQLETMSDLRDFTQKVRDTIWAHFKDENSSYEKIKSNRSVLLFNPIIYSRPLPGYDKRCEQIQQAKTVLSQVFKQIQTSDQLLYFVQDYLSVLDINSAQNFNKRLLDLISDHRRREYKPNMVYSFCGIQ